MADATTTIAMLRDAARRFNAQRHWEPFHSPKNLAMGMACEAAEVMEHFLWLDCEASRQVMRDPAKLAAVGEEVADVAVYLLNLANALGLDLSDAVASKMVKNAIKYPVPGAGGETSVNAVILSILLAAVLDGQAPLGRPPSPPPPSVLPALGQDVGVIQVSRQSPADYAPAPYQAINLPPAVPVPGPQQTPPPAGRAESTKPPPFRLVESHPQPGPTPPTGMPAPVTEPLPADGVVTPCVLLTRYIPQTAKAGLPLSYEIIVRNPGSVPVAQVRLDEELPAGTRFISALPMPAAMGERLTWIVESLGPGAEKRFKVEVEPGRDGEWKATATVTVAVSMAMKVDVAGGAPPALILPQPESTALPPALTITGPSTLPVGHPVVLFMRVTNTTGATIADAVVRVHLSPGLQHLQGNAIEGSLGELAPGQSKDLTLEAYALQIGKLTADATLLNGKKAVAAAQSVVLATEQPTLSVRQTGPLAPPTGSEQEFRIEVTNRGTSEVRDVRINDVLPDGVQYVGGDAGTLYDAKTRTLVWNIGMLLPGQARHVAFRARVRGAGPVVNRIGARAAGVPEAQLNVILRLGEGNEGTQQQINNR